ncbi:hypothetical protein NBO_14g0008 [Nosema bombycis CQ1]|uniref:DUF5094 domain-containing protein n=1 Tax=Nosema bombycis (strain CQ1 / CVCC 102059) TaxID=578461 RepID=R0MKQ9_NOSB1|nr:hypothetical protein NBO_14g0008 [Nosema bombycis CQ1]|eukprot:EOB14820.1 hypothetical protein NBO_14g0008 [Nosema bombycis CQ1]
MHDLNIIPLCLQIHYLTYPPPSLPTFLTLTSLPYLPFPIHPPFFLMKTPRKRITLKTPKRSTKTPIKVFKPQPSDITSLLKDLESHENKLLEKYKKENLYLRSLLNKGEGNENTLSLSLLGLDIKEINNEFIIKYKVEKKYLSFSLKPKDEFYIYKLKEHSEFELPNFLSEEISFEKQQVNKFFYKVMEIMIGN